MSDLLNLSVEGNIGAAISHTWFYKRCAVIYHRYLGVGRPTLGFCWCTSINWYFRLIIHESFCVEQRQAIGWRRRTALVFDRGEIRFPLHILELLP